MKIFTWMQTKYFNGRHDSKKPSLISATRYSLQEPHKEEFSERHHGLLAIGTFGKKYLKEDQERSNLEGNSSASQDHLQDLTLEELGKLQNELNLLLHKQVESTCSAELEAAKFELDKLFDRESILEGEKRNSIRDESKSKDGSLQHSSSLVLNRGKDVCLDNTKGAIRKKPLSFLLKIMLVCRSGIAAAPSLRDPLPESRIEKILRAILNKKIYPRSSTTALTMKKYLENRHMPKTSDDQDRDELNLKADNGSKWVNTDSEYIVLEI